MHLGQRRVARARAAWLEAAKRMEEARSSIVQKEAQKVIKYQLVEHYDDKVFERKVNTCLIHGWILQGGVSVVCFPTAAGTHSYRFSQAMTREEPGEQWIKFGKRKEEEAIP